MDWCRWTTLLGPESEGIWPPYTNVTDINSTCTTNDMNIIATGDDFGLVKLFKFPSKEKHAKCKKYVGHSSHVTSVRFTADDSKLVSAGGLDASVMIWERHAFEISHNSAKSFGYTYVKCQNCGCLSFLNLLSRARFGALISYDISPDIIYYRGTIRAYVWVPIRLLTP